VAGHGKSVYVWEDGLTKTPLCILIRHVFLWLQSKGLFEKEGFAAFLNLCLELQDAPIATLLERLPPAWERFYY
jgi:hypothetical protein